MKPSSTKTASSSVTMESLCLPKELLWEGKTEPMSPHGELFAISELSGNWLYDEDFAEGISLFTDDEDILILKNELEMSQELLEGDDLVVELSDLQAEHWNDVKLHSPTQLLDYPIGAIISHPGHLTKVQSPFDIGIFGTSTSYDTAILTQLTPPHSPPQTAGLTTFPGAAICGESNYNALPQHSSLPYSSATSAEQINATSTTAASPTSQGYSFPNWSSGTATESGTGSSTGTAGAEVNADIAREMQIVDEIVNTRVKELLQWHDECESLSSSSSAPSVAESISDEDWFPSSDYSSPGSSPLHMNREESLSMGSVTHAGTSKKRTRPYGRGVEDRKIRKKEQNKNAATRYRQKKKLEMEHVLGEEQELQDRNDELKRILADRTREAKYLKTLIREFYQKKK